MNKFFTLSKILIPVLFKNYDIFITGVAGFGSNLADYYIKKGYNVSGCDNLIGGEINNVNSS